MVTATRDGKKEIKEMSKTLLKVSGKSVKNALGFFFDGCHKIYVAETESDIQVMRKYGYGEMLPMSALENTFAESCYLRFISWANLQKPNIVPQGAKTVTFEYATGRGVLKSIVKFQ